MSGFPRIILPLLLALLCGTGAPAHTHEQAPARPKLVVAIVVDQLRSDYIDYLRPLMGSDGFARLEKEGACLSSVKFEPSVLDAVSATAMLMTGAYPNDNGVPAASVWDPAKLRAVPVMQDAKTVGVNTSATLSPASLEFSTVTDELMIDGAGLALVQSIAADPQVALALAGHAAGGAVWLNSTDGRWATSSYFKELPQPAANRNYRSALSARIDTMQWKPLLPLDRYPGLPAQKRQYAFRHTFPSKYKEVYEQFAASPRGNEEITALAIDYLKNLQMGRRGDTVDMLCLGYTAAPFRWIKDGDYRLELQDTYLRLDRDLSRLFQTIDQLVGLQNCVIMLTGTGYYNDAVAPDAKYRIPGGDFSTKRAMALLNSFLSAKYGVGNYVESYCGGGFHLATKLLENKGINPTEAELEAKQFLMKMSGVSQVYTLADLLSPADEQARRLSLSIDARTAPQLYVVVQPGWNLVEDHAFPVVTTPIRRGRVNTPAFFLAPGLISPGASIPR